MGVLTKTHEFHFLSAERLRSHHGPIPKYQELVVQDGWLRKRSMSILDVIHHTQAEKTVTVSHRWYEQGNPFDPSGLKVKKLIEYLDEHTEIEDVWFDWACIPQGDRTDEEQALFDRTLPVVNLLYLGTKVLRMIIRDYWERFWPQFEAYLAKQKIQKYGFEPEKSQRCDTIFIEGDADTFKDDISFFDTCSYEEAVARLSGDGVAVTSKKDKDVCLTKLAELKEFMAVIFNTLRK